MTIRLQNTKRGTPHTILYIIVFASILIRLNMLFFDPIVSRDGALYSLLSDNQLATEQIRDDLNQIKIVMPLYIICQQKVARLIGSGEKAGISINIFLGSLIPIFGYIICRKLHLKSWTALLTSIFLSIHPSLCRLSIQPQRDILYLFLCGLSLVYIIESVQRNIIYNSCFAGFYLGLGFLTRIEAFEIVLYAVLSYFVLFWVLHKKFKRFLLSSFSIIASFMLTVGIIVILFSPYLSFMGIFIDYLKRI